MKVDGLVRIKTVTWLEKGGLALAHEDEPSNGERDIILKRRGK